MRAWLVYNHSLNYEKFQEIHNLYIEAGKRLGIIVDLVANDEIISVVEQGSRELLCNHVYPDFVLFLDKDIYLAEQLEALGVPIFNNPKAIHLCDDKGKTMCTLSDYDISVPKTIMAPLNFTSEVSKTYLNIVAQALGVPCIIKESFGSFGEQVYLANTLDEMQNICKSIGSRSYIFQENVATSYGRDVRVYVAFDEVVITVKRTNTKDFRANVTNGGSMEVYKASGKMKELALEACKALELDFAGVDILFGENENPIICEVNSNAHIKNLLDVTGINFADNILEGILRRLK